MIELALLIPVLRRPQNVVPLVESVVSTTFVPYEIVFIASPSDQEEIEELEARKQTCLIMDYDYDVAGGDYARKINHAFNSIQAKWYFLGADDLRFYPYWFDHAMNNHKITGACVIGTNDLGNPLVIQGLHSTHSLVLGEYARECGTIDEPGKILHEGYPHEYVDNEFVETARCREAWSFSEKSVVEHLHPNWKKAKTDDIYEGQSLRMQIGKRLYDKRKRMWL
jgi:glycosyltransferase involved in cell wall biosynthesis